MDEQTAAAGRDQDTRNERIIQAIQRYMSKQSSTKSKAQRQKQGAQRLRDI